MEETAFTDIGFSNFSRFIFKENYVFIEEKDNPSEKVVQLRKNYGRIILKVFLNTFIKQYFQKGYGLPNAPYEKGGFSSKEGSLGFHVLF